jgi:hypothetical protein
MGLRSVVVAPMVCTGLLLCLTIGCASQNNKTAPKAVWSLGPISPTAINTWSAPAPESCFERLGSFGCSDQSHKTDVHKEQVWNIISVNIPVPDF